MTAAPLDLARIEGLLLDIDGVIYVDGEPIPSSIEAIRSLAARGLALRYVTNTTTRPRAALVARLQRLGLPVTEPQVYTPAALARRLLEASGKTRYRLLAEPALTEDLGAGRLGPEEGTPDWVVVGLHPPSFVHERLRVALNDLLQGARLLALHANRMWRTARGFEPSAGAYVRALEYAASVEATVVGKPSAKFFEQALSDLGLKRDRLAMVGDDVETDVGGAQAVGVSGILVRTGKFTPRSLERSGVVPALVVDDLADLARRLAE